MASIPFLKEIAQILLRPEDYDLSRTCVVFPNKRARLYLSKYIGDLTAKPVWAPTYYTISELMEKISGYTIADKLTLVFELYESYRQVTGSDESFDSFYPFCETMLADFDQIDKYMVNAADLFQNLTGLKSIEGKFNYLTEEQLSHIQRFWRTFSPEKISDSQELFISLWDSLPAVYNEFRSRLHNRNLAYEGMAYRKSVDGDTDCMPENISKYIFVGFNALSASEEKLFRTLKARKKAEFFWDYDSWYTNSELHEAGFFIRQNLKSFPQPASLLNEHLKTGKEHIFFLPVASNSGQASVLPQVFNLLGINEGPEIENTALVLADEGLLLPVLYALPEGISDINITMGYPLGSSVIYSLIDSLYQLNKNIRRSKNGSIQWYYNDLLALFSNPILSRKYAGVVDKIREAALARHSSWLNIHELIPGLNEDIIFKASPNICEYLLEIITMIIRDLPANEPDKTKSDPVQVELLFRVYTFLSSLNDIISGKQSIPGPDALFRLIRKMIRTMHIPFSGEPLAGLQVLGILETRTIDFKNVIILSCNEGILPGTSEKPSFIPYSLRKGFGMQTPEHQDAMYAYYFYRLIQRAEKVAFLYDSSSGGMKTGERSRFLHQLMYEMRMPVKEVHFEPTIGLISVKPVIIQKDGLVELLMKRYSEKPLSPSAINEYLNCPVRYYFHHIAGLPQLEEITSEVDARMFGTILHDTLKTIYSSFNKDVITEERINGILTNEDFLIKCIDGAFSKAFKNFKADDGRDENEGYNLIVRQVILKYIKQFLKAEAGNCPFTIHALEESFAATIPVSVKGISVNIRVGGTIDRIDLYNGHTRILDYKTGTVKNKISGMESLFDGSVKDRNDAAFQVLLYSLVYDQLHAGSKIWPGLIFFRQSNEEKFSYNLWMGKQAIHDFSAIKEEFETLLISSLEGLFNADLPFVQTQNLKTCNYCTYKLICRRE